MRDHLLCEKIQTNTNRHFRRDCTWMPYTHEAQALGAQGAIGLCSINKHLKELVCNKYFIKNWPGQASPFAEDVCEKGSPDTGVSDQSQIFPDCPQTKNSKKI